MFALENKVAAAVVAAASVLAPGAALSDCKLLQMAEFKLDPAYRSPVTDGEINGQPIKVLFDTGAAISLVDRAAAIRLKLPLFDTGGRVVGIGGESEVASARIASLKIGEFAKSNMELAVAGDPRATDDPALTLGSDFLAQVDIEFDMAHGALRLFRHVGCQPPQLVYWGAAYSQATLLQWSRDAPKLQAEAQVNGRQVLAELDSGASFSIMDVNAASAAGAKPAGLKDSVARGVGAAPQTISAVRLDSFSLGDETVSHVTVETTRLKEDFTYTEIGSITPRHYDSTPSMLVGDDFFRAHRIFFDTQDHLILFSYAGGPVFETPPDATPATSAPRK